MSFGDTTTTSTTTVPDRGRGEQDLISLLQSLTQQTAGNAGNLDSLAQGQGFQLSPEMIELIRQQTSSQANQSRQRAFQDADDTSRAIRGDAAGRGIQGSSIEAANQALGGQQLQRTLGDIENQRSFQFAQGQQQASQQGQQGQLDANSLLFNLLTQSSGQLNENFLRDRLARSTTTQTQSGGGIGGLFQSAMGIGQTLAGAGAFNPLLASLGGAQEDDGIIDQGNQNYYRG
jgi:hypothetical protein